MKTAWDVYLDLPDSRLSEQERIRREELKFLEDYECDSSL
jgi:hypothetical protein